MRRICIVVVAMLSFLAHASAQKKASDPDRNKLFEEAMARDEEPLTKVYVHPQIADMQMLSTERMVFGPYKFKLSKNGALSEGELVNAQGRALYRATMESDADLMIGTLYDSYILESDANYVVVELSAYPAKFVNFRPIPMDGNMPSLLQICYPVLPTTVINNSNPNTATK